MIVRRATVAMGAVLMTLSALTLSPLAAGTATAGRQATPANLIEVDTWLLLQSDGEELYGQMCSGCHGTLGAGPAAPLETVPTVAPALTGLRAAGVPEAHWTYVINSPCEDPHHSASDGTEAMPCWRMIFREALNSEAAPLMVSARLNDYLGSIQE